MTTPATETPAAPAVPAEPIRDLASIAETLLAAPPTPSGAQATAPAQAAPAAASQSSAKPDDKAKESAAQVYERAIKAERKAVEDRRSVKAEREQLEKERAAFAAERTKADKDATDGRELARLVKDDPRELLRRAGMTYEEFTKKLAAGARTDPRVSELEQRLEREKAERETREKAEAEKATKAASERREQEATAAMRELAAVAKADKDCGAAAWLLENDPANARTILSGIVQKVAEETGQIPAYDVAAKKLNESLVTDFHAMLAVPAFLEIAKAAIGAVAKAAEPKSANTKPAQHASQGAKSEEGPPTITQEQTTAGGAGTAERELTPEERYERLVKKLEGAKAA